MGDEKNLSVSDISAVMNNGKGGSGNDLMALLPTLLSMTNSKNNEFGGNGIWPILLLLLLGRRDGFLGGEGRAVENNLGREFILENANNNKDSIINNITDNKNTEILLRAIDGNASSIRELSNLLGIKFDTVNSAICEINKGIALLAGEVKSTSKDVINAVILGDKDIIQRLADCCCEIRSDIKDSTNTISRELNHVEREITEDITSFRHSVDKEFCATNTNIREVSNKVDLESERIKNTVINGNKDLACLIKDEAKDIKQLTKDEFNFDRIEAQRARARVAEERVEKLELKLALMERDHDKTRGDLNVAVTTINQNGLANAIGDVINKNQTELIKSFNTILEPIVRQVALIK